MIKKRFLPLFAVAALVSACEAGPTTPQLEPGAPSMDEVQGCGGYLGSGTCALPTDSTSTAGVTSGPTQEP